MTDLDLLNVLESMAGDMNSIRHLLERMNELKELEIKLSLGRCKLDEANKVLRLEQ